MRYAWLFIIINFISIVIYSQSAQYFHLNKPAKKITGSLYNTINFIDSRTDTTDFGKVFEILEKKDLTLGGRIEVSMSQERQGKTFYTGRMLPVELQEPFSTQLNWLIYHFTDSTAGNKEMLLQLRKFKFYEIFQNKFYQGFCTLRLNLYEVQNENFCPIGYLDTVIYMDWVNVTKELFNGASNVISDLVHSHLKTGNIQRDCFNKRSVMNIDSVEKSKMALYTDKYIDGAYTSFESFKNQKPDFKLTSVKQQQGSINTLFLISKKGKKMRRNINAFFAIVYENKPYIVGDLGCYPLEKKEGDFYFIAKARVSPDKKTMTLGKNMGYVVGGITGYIIVAKAIKNSTVALFKTKLDHLDGSFIWIKRVD